MKVVGIVLLLILTAATMLACKGGVDTEVKDNISELTLNVFVGRTENAEVTLITGEREAPYAVDGVSNARQPYTIISVKPSAIGETAAYDYVIKAAGNEYRGKLSLHPFGITFIDTVNKKAEGAVSVTLTRGEHTEEVVLNPQFNENMITWEQALETGISCIKKEVDSLYEGKNLLGEVYIRFTGDPLNESAEYYWYIAVVGNNGRTYAALIHPLSGEVIAAKKI